MKRSESPLPKDPIGKGMALHLNKVKFPSSKDAMGKFGWNWLSDSGGDI